MELSLGRFPHNELRLDRQHMVETDFAYLRDLEKSLNNDGLQIKNEESSYSPFCIAGFSSKTRTKTR